MEKLTDKSQAELYDERAYTLTRITRLLEVCGMATRYSPSNPSALKDALAGEYAYLSKLTNAIAEKRGIRTDG